MRQRARPRPLCPSSDTTTAPATQDPTTPSTTTLHTTAQPTETATLPSTNPYASLTDIPSTLPTRIRECVTKLSTAPYQQPPLTSTLTTSTAATVARYATMLVSDRITADDTAGTVDGPQNGRIGQTQAVQYVFHRVGITMPATIAEQITIGQRVAPTAISPADLIYSDFTGTQPRTVMIAISATLATSVPTTRGQPVTLVTISPTSSLVVKRVLSEGGTQR
ncbi:hypothetical protein ACORG1_22755 [Mycobacterium sp. TJFP1]|nr:hypothetical protein [Mycolicibacterium sp. CH28]QTK22467.1 hypothetical protein [Rhodococcus sp. B2]TGD83749.1 hypothetical protein BayCH28_28515 [Mycolicibacterium sp. CH28]